MMPLIGSEKDQSSRKSWPLSLAHKKFQMSIQCFRLLFIELNPREITYRLKAMNGHVSQSISIMLYPDASINFPLKNMNHDELNFSDNTEPFVGRSF